VGLQGLAGQPAMITGAAGGIARASALRLAHEGARVLAADIKAEGLAETAVLANAAGTPVETLVVDVGAALRA
jgi:NAD(P)-dependent dehydrogenase (short-subunit alcohol dehydrogenase family)